MPIPKWMKEVYFGGKKWKKHVFVIGYGVQLHATAIAMVLRNAYQRNIESQTLA